MCEVLPVCFSMKKSGYFLAFAIVCCCSAVSVSQNYSIKNYSIRDGLSTNSILDAAQDISGRMWFATNDGASVYDGSQWTNYSSKNSILENNYRRIFADSAGVIWLSPNYSTSSIAFLFNDQWNKIPPITPKEKPPTDITGLAVLYHSGQAVVCATSQHGFFLYLNNIWRHYSKNDGLADDVVYSVTADAEKLYLGTRHGISIVEISGAGDVRIYADELRISEPVLGVFFEKAPGSLTGTRKWIFGINWIGYEENKKIVLQNARFKLGGFGGVGLLHMAIDKRGAVYFGDRFAKYKLDTTMHSFIRLSKEDGFISDGATSMFCDKEGNVWITDTRGIDKITYQLFQNFRKSSGLLEDEVSAICEYSPGKFIFGHNRGFTLFSNQGAHKAVTTSSRGIEGRILDICQDNKGHIWCAASELGLMQVRPDGTYKTYAFDGKRSVSSVVWSPTYGLLVCSGSVIKSFDGNKFQPLQKYPNVAMSMRKMFQFFGNVYTVSNQGVFRLNGDYLVPLIRSSDTRQKNVFSLFSENGGENFLIGSEGGLFRLRDGVFSKVNERGLSIDKPVYFITRDANKCMWFGTADGVVKWDGQHPQKVYTVADGLAGYETNRAAGYLDSQKYLWIGTSTGLSKYIGKASDDNFPAPNASLSDIVTNFQKSYRLDRDIELEYNENNLSFHFRAISFVNESSIEYKIMLEGYDKDWRLVSHDQISRIQYSDLPTGTYRFLVMVRNHFTDWSAPSVSGTIRIKNPFYLRLWFIILALFLFCVAIFLFYKYYLARKYSQHLEVMVQKRTDELTKSEAVLKQTLDNLEELVKERTYELAQANEQLLKEIEERTHFELFLRESEERFRKLINESWDVIILTDKNNEIIFVSSAVDRLLGYREVDFYGTQWKKYINPDDYEGFVEEFTKGIAHPNEILVLVFRCLHKDGSWRWIEANMVNMLNDPSVNAIVSHCRDITEKKAAEEELNNYSKQLEALNESKDKLFSIIAHDLRAPFTAILGYSSILKTENEALTRVEMERYTTNIENAAKNTLLLIESLLDWSRTQLGGIQFNPKKLYLNEVITDILHLLHPDSVNKSIALTSQVSVSAVVFADENLLKTIIRNLVHNAIKFTPEGGKITVSSIRVENFIEISVSDTGIGLPPESIPHIFELDTQQSRRGTANERGTGLGLPLCKEFVAKHGGQIWVESVEGKGTTFTFTLPM